MKRLLILLMLLTATQNLWAQNENSFNRDYERGTWSSYIQLGGPQIIGLHFDNQVGKRVSLNGSIGVLGDFSIGPNYYLIRKGEFGHHMFMSVKFGAVREIELFSSGGDFNAGVYVPIGWEYKGPKGFAFQLEAGANFTKDLGQANTTPVLVALRIGRSSKRKSQ